MMELAHRRLSTHSIGSGSSSSSHGSGGGGVGGGGGGREVNIAVLGARGVGKSAIIVRYLTRRFIGDYDPQMDAIFTHNTQVDNKHLLLHILDTAWQCTGREPCADPITWADGFLLVFSLTDPASWACAQELVTRLRRARDDERLPVALAGNKSDLVHLRRVDSQSCAAWAAQHSCAYREVSAGEDPESVQEVFRCLCRQVPRGGVGVGMLRKREKLSRVMQRPAVAAKLQIRQGLRSLAERTLRSRTSTL
ncbi:ras-related and estrogen-regulated growth inhibitor-like [Babylonia areolata]|uniref:ras-related and estrogen-regulated growth inhibitor-like n=1 Tax=Babylonia areolata TaxID=304850 RepID=UPI003FD39807